MIEVKRYVLRYRGAGAKPKDDVARIRALPGLTVLDDSSGRMMLIEAPEDAVSGLPGLLPQWLMSEERVVPLPDLRERVHHGS